MNYQIIKNRDLLQDFIINLPTLQDNETWYVSLMARKKYYPEMTLSSLQLSRFTSKSHNLLQKIEKLEIREGLYSLSDREIYPDSLALYISANPRCIRKATLNLTKRLITLISEGKCSKLEQDVLSELHKSKGRGLFVIADFDIKDTFRCKLDFHDRYLRDKININAYQLLKTRGGYHCIIESLLIRSKYGKTWWKSINSIPEIDKLDSDMLIPIPGCIQGNFSPYFIQ